MALRSSGQRTIQFVNLKKVLIEELKKRKSSGKAASGSRFLRIEYRTEKTDPLLWLKNQEQNEKVFFEGRGKNKPGIAGAGCAYMVTAGDRGSLRSVYCELRKELIGGVRFFGGISFFKNGSEENEWSSFGNFKFILPRFEYIFERKTSFFAVNYSHSELKNENVNSLIAEVEHLKFSNLDEFKKTEKNTIKIYNPDFYGWKTQVSKYLQLIKNREIEKIVAARRLELDNTGNLDPFKVVSDLKRSGNHSSHFLVSFDGNSFFLGATPERLFYRDGKLIETESLAGTAPRGIGKEDDDILGNKLLASDKEKSEHDYVTDEIKKKLDPICELVEVSERVLVKLSNLQHLYRRISGKIKSDVFDGDILEELFPTPAVSGFPVKRSVEILGSEEPFARGWYSGVVGFVSKEVSDYYVAIRSMLITKNRVFIYSGAGIVEGSDPVKEWDEINLKTEKFKKILNYEN